ncbi:MAG TPA: ABC transporter ATP-binding protein [Jatrophihabitantaceae bacterium]|jgi:oligopeptide/dipeptide ABC transporter ATP-binding protein
MTRLLKHHTTPVTQPTVGVDGEPGAALDVQDLHVRYRRGTHAVRGVSLSIEPGRCLAVVGESGSGKSTIALALLGLLPAGTHCSGSAQVQGQQLVGVSQRDLRAVRGCTIGYVGQDPMRSFDPLYSVGASVAEAWRARGQRPPAGEVTNALEELGIADAARRARLRAHQWSGGMLQRAAIAAANAHGPCLIIADEPTSALDADRADSVLSSLRSTQVAVLLISHDLALVGRHSDTVAVMYAGRIVEHGPAERVLTHPRHPYTAALLAASPRLGAGLPVPLPGAPPRLDVDPEGCAFAPRCVHAQDHCRARDPEFSDDVACVRHRELRLTVANDVAGTGS